MTNTKKLEITEAIAYSRLVSNTFTPGECILLQFWRNQDKPPKPDLQNKYTKLRKEIRAIKWKKPLIRYTEGGVLQMFNGEWKNVNNN